MALADPALAQKQGGILRVFHRDSPASMSIVEEGSISAIMPMMGVFNNLVLFDQHVPQNRVQSIVPDLATSWTSNEEGTELTFTLREGVKWHDGKPFTAADVKCTYDLLTGKAKEKLRLNYREAWFLNLGEMTTNGDSEVTFHLKRPQPAFISLLASGYSPIYPCHVSARDMRTHPVGTGPFKFVEYKPNQSIKVERNPDYWKPGRPYLDGIEYTIIPNRSTAILAFVAGKFDMTFPYEVSIPLVKQVKSQAPQAICEVKPMNGRANLLVNPAPPFDNPALRRAMQLSLDRKSFIDILGEGQYDVGAVLQPPPEGIWGMPREMLEQLTGYGPDVKKNREEARALMRSLGYGPDNRLKVKVSARNIAWYRDPAAILIDQLKEIWIDGELDAIETANWVPKADAQGFYGRVEPFGERRRRPRHAVLRELLLPLVSQLYRLQSRGGCVDRPAVGGNRSGEAQRAGLADRAQADRGCGSPDHFLHAAGHLLAAAGQGFNPDGEQHLQQLADGGRLARQVTFERDSTWRGRPLRCSGRSVHELRPVFEMHGIVMGPLPAPDEAVPLEDVDDFGR